ncbi:hypothetical protein OG500_36915 [Kitasatospora sp. NBC_01250]|uniref:hypothetical protein n=1 Tax=unclassified Kitasatospora TaxID=2633591 RepID=UPI002E10BA98|nr:MULTISPECIES: hypothetical protein [unclassified Kitasatospora]WSJ71542.1 hypothetical protein OG294_38605 [Kitasatospora sp. NBC_01302]
MDEMKSVAMRLLITLGYGAVLAALVVGTLVGNLFGVDDVSRLLLTLIEFVTGLLVLSVVMAALPRRLQQQVAGAQPTSAMMRRRVDRLLVAIGGIPARSARADVAALARGASLYARAVRIDGPRPALGVLLFEAPADGQAVLRWHQGRTVETIPAPYTVTELAGVRSTATARTLKATSTVWIGETINVQLTPMDLEVLRHVAAAATPERDGTSVR